MDCAPFDAPARFLISSLLAKDPRQRADAADVKDSLFFEQLDW